MVMIHSNLHQIMGNGPICISAAEPGSYEAAFCLFNFLDELAENFCILQVPTFNTVFLNRCVNKCILCHVCAHPSGMYRKEGFFDHAEQKHGLKLADLCEAYTKASKSFRVVWAMSCMLLLGLGANDDLEHLTISWTSHQDGESVLKGIVGLSPAQRLFPARAMSLDGLLKVSLTDSSTSFDSQTCFPK